MTATKVRSIRLQGFQQFDDLTLDFTHPETGEPLDRICFIGPNGTGKSTLLRVLDHAWESTPIPGPTTASLELHWDVGVRTVARRLPTDRRRPSPHSHPFALWWSSAPYGAKRDERFRRSAADHVLVHALAEAERNPGVALDGAPKASLSEATARMTAPTVRQEVSTATIKDVWLDLIARMQGRLLAREDFERRPENLDRTKAELITAFDSAHPDPLQSLAALWDRILAPAGLSVDVAGVKLQRLAGENLALDVLHATTGAVVPFGALSTGMRNFLFRIGHLHLLFFDRALKGGLVLVDEPENSLFPDFLFALMESYEEILRPHPVQLFVATHNPIVAAQFHPHERIVLDWEDGRVTSRRGTAPKGDDPNDLLLKDFGLPHVMGPDGLAAWRRFQDLRRQLRHAADEPEKLRLMEEAARIGRDYGFGP